MSDAIAGLGATFKRGDGTSSETFTTLGENVRIGADWATRENIEVTNLGSTGGWREFITGFRDGGIVTLEQNWVRDSYEQLLNDFNDDDTVNYQIVLNDTGATTFDFAGRVTGMPIDIPFDAQVSCTISIKITGEPTLTS
jgi:predicted secreted protein